MQTTYFLLLLRIPDEKTTGNIIFGKKLHLFPELSFDLQLLKSKCQTLAKIIPKFVYLQCSDKYGMNTTNSDQVSQNMLAIRPDNLC